MQRIWQDAEIEFLREHYPENWSIDIAKALGRTKQGVSTKAHLLGIKKSKRFLREQSDILISVGKKFHFKKGEPSHNKGVKMLPHVFEKVKHSFFKPGNIPHNGYKYANGSIVKRKCGYWYIRLSMGKWRQLHTYTWEQANRPICSKSEMVKFRDGNKDNCSLDNLYLADRRQHMLDNSIHRYPIELKQTLRTLGLLNKRIKEHEKQNL